MIDEPGQNEEGQGQPVEQSKAGHACASPCRYPAGRAARTNMID
jgi:hypothetical protein